MEIPKNWSWLESNSQRTEGGQSRSQTEVNFQVKIEDSVNAQELKLDRIKFPRTEIGQNRNPRYWRWKSNSQDLKLSRVRFLSTEDGQSWNPRYWSWIDSYSQVLKLDRVEIPACILVKYPLKAASMNDAKPEHYGIMQIMSQVMSGKNAKK